MKSAFELRTRFVAIFALLLMFMSIVGGVSPANSQKMTSGSIVVASYASSSSKGVNDLWGTVDKSSVGNNGLNGASTNMTTVVDKAKEVAKAITSVLTIISFVCLLYSVAKLAMSAGNPQTRKIALTGILFAGISLALFGGSWIVVSFFWNVLN